MCLRNIRTKEVFPPNQLHGVRAIFFAISHVRRNKNELSIRFSSNKIEINGFLAIFFSIYPVSTLAWSVVRGRRKFPSAVGEYFRQIN